MKKKNGSICVSAFYWNSSKAFCFEIQEAFMFKICSIFIKSLWKLILIFCNWHYLVCHLYLSFSLLAICFFIFSQIALQKRQPHSRFCLSCQLLSSSFTRYF